MSSFDELLSRPLPSTSEGFTEGADFDPDKEINAAMKEFDETNEECGNCEDAGTDNGIDFDDLFDGDEDGDTHENEDDLNDDIDELENELGINGNLDDDELNDMDADGIDDEKEDNDSDYYVPKAVDDPTPADELNPEDDAKADQMMNVVSTPLILESVCSDDEIATFLENGEADTAISEGLFLESDYNAAMADIKGSSDELFEEATKFANPKQKYRMTKKARLKQLYELSLQIEARLHRDPYYPKIQKAYKIERTIKKGWRKRYGALAKKRAMRYLRNLMKSGSPTLKTAAKRLQ